MATIKDIAKLSGYSVGTVSRVLNDRPDVSEEARKRIREIIARENYQPNTNAKLLKQTHTSSVTVIVKGSGNRFLNTILEKTQLYLRRAGEDATVEFLPETADAAETALQIIRRRNPKGIIFIGADLKNFKAELEDMKTPCVLTAVSAESLNSPVISSFSTDDFEGGKAAMRLLVENGHTNVLIVGGYTSDEPDQVWVRRRDGAVEVLKEYGIPFDRDRQYIRSLFSMEDGYRKIYDALSADRSVTAVFGLNDMIAIGGMRAAHELGFSIPEDLSIIGFDGVEYADYTVPRLATIRQDTDELAFQSVEDLLYRINYSRPPVHKHVRFSVVAKESISSR